MFNKVFTPSQFSGTNNLNNPFDSTGKAAVEILQKNIESINNLLKITMEPITALVKFSDKDAFAKEIKKQTESLNKQVADLTVLNQTNFDTIVKQFETATKSFSPLTEQLKKELETASASSKETLQTIIDSYTAFAAPSIEANKETFEKLTEQIKTGISDNIKFWSDLMNSNNLLTAKTIATKVDSGLLRISADNKKHVNDNSFNEAVK